MSSCELKIVFWFGLEDQVPFSVLGPHLAGLHILPQSLLVYVLNPDVFGKHKKTNIVPFCLYTMGWLVSQARG